MQQARHLTLTLDERFDDIGFLIRDCGSNFTASFDAVFQATGTRILRTAVQVLRMNATCERLAGTLRRDSWTASSRRCRRQPCSKPCVSIPACWESC